jgi:uncharacterized protein (TIGR04168 family)
VKIGVIGDVHLAWDERDTQALDAAGYDLILFVGDLAGYGTEGGLTVARAVAKLQTPALVMPGNHDAVTVPQLASEVLPSPTLAREALALGMRARVKQLAKALGPVALGGYSLHRYDQLSLTVLAARPHSMGGPRLSYRRYLAYRFGVRTMSDSSARLCALLDGVPEHDRLLILAHNGPHALGATRDAIYGCDFRPEQGDWGDPDLRVALTHAQNVGRPVTAVIAGHMHHSLRGGGQRTWLVDEEGTQHVNAAQVPRFRRSAAGEERHHVRITLTDQDVLIEPVWLRLDPAEHT